MTREELQALKLPDTPGVYHFVDAENKILYIGKAASLRDRVRSYFSDGLLEMRSPAVAGMVEKAVTISWTETDSVLEALILEANLIKQHQPLYNAASKDNKSFNYLVITKERFPRVLIVRGRELFQTWSDEKIKKLFGPFPHGLQFKEAVKIVRRIFPFRDSKCIPCEDQLRKLSANSRLPAEASAQAGELAYKKLKPHMQPSASEGVLSRARRMCKPCFNRQIGLCPGVCTGEISREEYLQQIKHICELFSGNFKGLKRQLAKEMKDAAKKEDFEKAEMLRRQCHALEHIRDVSLIRNESRIAAGGGTRIEAYDVAHTSGNQTVAVMTVVNNGEVFKDAYRKFKIRTATNNDVAALKEVLSRRLAHIEWPLPRIIIVDGGKAQMRAAQKVLKDAGVAIPVVGVVKNEFHKPEKLLGDARSIAAFERDILLANNESHRFALKFHRARRQVISS